MNTIPNINELELLDKGVAPGDILAIQRHLKSLNGHLQTLEKYKKENKIEYFVPNRPQAKFLEALLSPRFKVLAATGGNQFGKTALGVISALSILFGEYLWTDPPIQLKFPHTEPRMIRHMAQDFKDHARTVVVPEIKKWWPKHRRVKIRNDPVSGVPAFFTDLKTGSMLQIMSAKQEPSAHAGWKGDAYICDEPFRKDVYSEIIPRLLVRNGRILLCLTLLKEHAWIDHDILRAVDADGLPKLNIFVVHGNVYDNVGFGIETEQQVDEVMSLYGDDAVTLQCRKWGIPLYRFGLIFPTFDRQIHVVPRGPVHNDSIIDIAIDAHPQKKHSVLFRALDKKGYHWLVDEIHEHYDAETLAHVIGKLCKRRGYLRIGSVIIDPLSKGMGNIKIKGEPKLKTVFEIMRDILSEYGLYLRTSGREKARYRTGILETNRLLMGPNKLPSLFVFSDMSYTIKSIEVWTYKTDTEEPGENGKDQMVNLCWLSLLKTEWSLPRKKTGQRQIGSWMSV